MFKAVNRKLSREKNKENSVAKISTNRQKQDGYKTGSLVVILELVVC